MRSRAPDARTTSRWRHGYTLIEVLVSCFIVGLLFALVMSAVQAAREAARRTQCSNNLHMIGLALQNYLSEASYFPPIVSQTELGPGAPSFSAHSFSPLVRMLPHLDQAALFHAANFTNMPEFSPGVDQNMTVMTCSLDLFLSPSDGGRAIAGYGRTNYRFSVGPTHTLASGRHRPETLLGPFTTHYDYRAADFRDGLSNTIGVSERLQGDWLDGSTKAGGDYFLHPPGVEPTMDSAAAIAACSALSPDAAVESRGGETWFLSGFHCTNYSHCVTPNSTITNCATDQELEPLHSRIMHSGVFSASSYHGAGVNVVFMDGSVRHARDSISISVWRALSTRSNGEVASLGD